MDPQVKSQLQIISAYMGSKLTDEQMEFASDFTQNTISFSDPGVGKTHTLVAGLIMLQKHYKVRGDLVATLSFTNAAVSEIAGRYEKLAKRCSIAPNVNFMTFHSLSNKILKMAFNGNMKVEAYIKPEVYVERLQGYLQKYNNPKWEDKNYVKRFYKCITELNSSLIFDEEHVKTRYSYLKLNVDYEQFTYIRLQMFMLGIVNGVIAQGDIPIYCLFALLTNQELAKFWRSKYKVMIVDEFQDLSLLHLQILNIITDTLIVIGDIKQQIYMFNGSCPEIVKEYYKVRNNPRVCNLTKSFRCGQQIADFATEVIKPSFPDVDTFEGTGEGYIELNSSVKMNWEQIVADIKADINKSSEKLVDYMFLYRNNVSAYAIIERLYKAGLPFRCSKFKPIWEIPIFDALCKFAKVAHNPYDPTAVADILKYFPEFRNTIGEFGLVKIMKTTGASFLDIKYRYKENSSYEIIEFIKKARERIIAGKSAGIILNGLMPLYDHYVQETWKLEEEPEYYISLVGPICNEKTYENLIAEELEKSNINERCIQAGTGIRCYTVHSAKGLEAETVYLFDCDENVFPNWKVINNKIEAGCILEAADDIRAERNLLYVACTRASKNLYILYHKEPSSLLPHTTDGPDLCETLDEAYSSNKVAYDDVKAFFNTFCKGVDFNGK